ncbi:MAG: cell envelope integrity protein TolA [Burkholderiaceae bacterium]
MDSTLQRDIFLPHRPQGLGKGFALAVLAHLLLVAALTVSVRWRASSPAAVEAELWAAVPQMAAPRAVEPTPRPQPKPEPPKPVPPPPPPAPAPAPAPAVPDAQIAIEQARKAEQAQREQADRKEAARKAAEREKAIEKAREKEASQKREKQEREQAAEREREREQQEIARKKKEQAEAQREAKALEAQREANLKRIAGMAGASGDANATGRALQSAGPSAGYAGRIRARIKPNIVFADTVSGNPVASVEVRVAPDGTITARRIVKSSGAPAWDDAVLRAIDRTEVLPRDTDGRVPSSMTIDFKPRD